MILGMAAVNSAAEKRSKNFAKREERRTIRKLHDAVKRNDIKVVTGLLEQGVNPDFHYSGINALQIASELGFAEVCRLLIDHGADVDKYNSDGRSVISLAAWNGHHEVVRLLLQKGADMDKTNNLEETPLCVAAIKGRMEVVKVLVHAGCDLNRPNLQRQSPLACAAYKGLPDIVEFLVESGCNINQVDYERRTPLVIAAQMGFLNVAKILIKAGCKLNAQEQYGGTALYFAAKEGHEEMVSCLIEAGADLNLSDTKGITPLIMAVKKQYHGIVKALIEAGCDLDTADYEAKQTAIHHAIRQATQYFGESDSQISLVRTIINAGCDLNVQDRSGWTPLYQAVFGHELEIIELLLGLKVRLDLVTDQGDTILHAAVYGNQDKIMQMLIDQGCDVNQTNLMQQLPLHKAIVHRSHINIVKLLIKAGSHLNVRETELGQTPLFAAIHHNNCEAAQLLIDAGCDVNLANLEGDTPLWVACDKGLEEIVTSLLNVPGINLDAGFSHIPIHASALHGFTSIVEALLRAGCNVNKLSDLGVSALYLAVDFGRMHIARLLVKYGANPSAPHHMPKALRVKCCRAYSDPHPHLELEPLCAAMRNDDFEALHLVVLATPRMPYNIIRTLQDLMFRTPYAHQARLSEEKLLSFARFFALVQAQPRSLQAECRGIIRECLGHRVLQDVATLEIPPRLKQFITLERELPITQDE